MLYSALWLGEMPAAGASPEMMAAEPRDMSKARARRGCQLNRSGLRKRASAVRKEGFYVKEWVLPAAGQAMSCGVNQRCAARGRGKGSAAALPAWAVLHSFLLPGEDGRWQRRS